MLKVELGLVDAQFKPKVVSRRLDNYIGLLADIYSYLIRNGLRTRKKLTCEEAEHGMDAAHEMVKALRSVSKQNHPDGTVNFSLRNTDGTSWLFWARKID